MRGRALFGDLSYFKCVRTAQVSCSSACTKCMHCQEVCQHGAGHAYVHMWWLHSTSKLEQKQGTCSCSPCHFFRLGTAHIFLLGILADFWAQWLPSAEKKRKANQHPDSPFAKYVLPPAVRKHISSMAAYIKLTELFGKPYRDITKCALQRCNYCGI